MTDPNHHPLGAGEDTDVRPDAASPPRMPRWVKWPAIVIGVSLVVFLVLQLTGVAGNHGPKRHGADTRPTGIPESGLQQPRGGHTPAVNHGPSDTSTPP
ncbi:MAG TPA: hypothetical protein VE465_29435 [Streptosporangiaceae bacterium]|jgi:hypothetical protein|nr:hypothetical protein [Streptosporangiaceae bacterium]